MITSATTGFLLMVSVIGGDVIATHMYDTYDECIAWAEAYTWVRVHEPDSLWTIPEASIKAWRFETLVFECHSG